MNFIGIDLGTSNTVVSFKKGEKVETILFDDGSRLLPSVVSVTKNKTLLIGNSALSKKKSNPENTFYSTKRFIGRRSSNVKLKEYAELPYKVDVSQELVGLYSSNLKKRFEIHEIAAQILIKVKESAEKYIGTNVDKCVISVPAYFDNNQRIATKQAAEIAGLEVISLVNEPTAALLAFLNEGSYQGNYIVFDLGGGTFDISLIEADIDIEKKSFFEVKATKGDSKLGGDDFNYLILQHFVEEIKKKLPNTKFDEKLLSYLREESEKLKKQLSVEEYVEVDLQNLPQKNKSVLDLQMTFTRKDFENICSDLFSKIKNLIKKFINENISVDEISNVILVGGSSRMKKFAEIVKELTNKEPLVSLNPDEIVSYGCCQYALIRENKEPSTFISDVTPLSLGTGIIDDVNSVIIPANSAVPCSRTEVYTTVYDNQEAIDVDVFQGERQIASENILLGNFELRGIEKAERGVPNIEITFTIDLDGILHCEAEDVKTKSKKSIFISNSFEISKEEISLLREEALKFFNSDKEFVNNSLIKRYSAELKPYRNQSSVAELLKISNNYLEGISNINISKEKLINKLQEKLFQNQKKL